MPLYEYECFLCGNRFERIQKVSADPVKECPACGGAVRRLLGVPALQFKGSGFYITDYGKGNGSASSSAGTASNGGAEPSSGGDSATSKKETAKDSTTKSDVKASTS